MTDETTTEQPRTLGVFTCINRRHPTRSCYALIENTDEMRAEHRAWHVAEENGRKAQRDAIKARDDEIARLHDAIGGYRRDIAAYEREVAGFHGEVQRVEAPTVAPALEINRDGYTDDELDDEPDAPEIEWGFAQPAAEEQPAAPRTDTVRDSASYDESDDSFAGYPTSQL